MGGSKCLVPRPWLLPPEASELWSGIETGSASVFTEEATKMDKKQPYPLLKLSEESLMREPEEVFDLLEKIGEG